MEALMKKLYLLFMLTTINITQQANAEDTPAGLQAQISTTLSQLRTAQAQEPSVISNIQSNVGLTYAQKMGLISAYQSNINALEAQLNNLNIQYNNLVGA